MVFRGEFDRRTTLVSVKHASASLAIGSRWIAAWDLGGRLYSLWKDGHTYRRGLNGRVLHKWTDPGDVGGRGGARVSPADRDGSAAWPAGRGGAGVSPADRGGAGVSPAIGPYDLRSRVYVDGSSAHALAGEAAGMLTRVLTEMTRDPSGWTDRSGSRPDADGLEALERCARFDARASEEDAARFAAVFSPVGVLPPDQYLSIVLQATEGCSFGTCTFCSLYHQPYRVKSPDEFAAHAAAVLDYLGDSALLRRRSVFLGAANALAVPTARLVEFLGAVQAVFGSLAGGTPAPTRPEGQTPAPPGSAGGTPAPPGGLPIHAFVDGFTGLRKTADDYLALGARGLRRVYIGLESGHDPLLAFVRKPATSDEAVETVRAIKAGGVSVGVIVMAGLGGRRFSSQHVADTARAVNAMALDAADLLYFSDLVEEPGTTYPRQAADGAIGTLDLSERLAQIAAIHERLRFPAAPPRIARYDVREFVY